jgi:hypothetical protein
LALPRRALFYELQGRPGCLEGRSLCQGSVHLKAFEEYIGRHWEKQSLYSRVVVFVLYKEIFRFVHKCLSGFSFVGYLAVECHTFYAVI